jgi:hypothetical protein
LQLHTPPARLLFSGQTKAPLIGTFQTYVFVPELGNGVAVAVQLTPSFVSGVNVATLVIAGLPVNTEPAAQAADHELKVPEAVPSGQPVL